MLGVFREECALYAGVNPEKSQVKETVASCREQTGSEKVLLMGHSAGGWLARAALGAGNWEEGIASEDIITGTTIILPARVSKFIYSSLTVC